MTRPQSSSYPLGYRSDVEGLRAVAILLVVAAHARVPWLAGGFIGVDVFFVLSGYLITGLLIQEINATGDLRFTAFYARRLRRLMPALLLMLACVCSFGWLLIPASDQLRQATAAGSAAVWLSNLYFAFSNMGYFSPGSESNLFLHTWSLGVEEQFYVMWPLLMVMVAGAWKGTKRPVQLGRLKIAMPLVFALSLLLSVWWTYRSPHLAFYMMPSRTWQFALGALVFIYFGAPNAHKGDARTHGIYNAVLTRLGSWMGLAMIVVAASVLDGKTPYPGLWALMPAFGAAVIIAAGISTPRVGAGRLLSLQPMQTIGRVSYAWYLWHWPVLLLGATVADMDSALNRIGLVALSLLLAALSYRFVEAPIRRMRRLVAKPRMAIFVGLAMMILANVGAVRWHNAARNYLRQPDYVRYVQARGDAPVIYGMGCDDWYHSSEVRICAFGSDKAAHTAVAFGDSVALQWFPALAKVFDKPGWRLLVVTKSSCPMVDEPIFYARIGRIYSECATWRKRALKQLTVIKPDIVILGSTYTYNYSRDQWITGAQKILNEVSASAKRVYILRSTPTLPFDGPICLAPRSHLYRTLMEKNRCTAPAHNQRFDDVYAWLQFAADHFDNVRIVDMTDAICPDGLCQAERNGMVVFRDSQHLTATFARSLGPFLAQQLSGAAGYRIQADAQALLHTD